MRALWSTYGGRGDIEPLVGLAVRLRALGAQVRVCVPPDCAERLAEVGVPLVPVGPPVRQLVHGATRPSVADVPRCAVELIAEQFEKLPAAAEGCDALVATGLFPVAASAQSVAEKLGIRSVFAAYRPISLPPPHRPPHPLPGRPLPPDVTDNRVLNDLDVQSYNALSDRADCRRRRRGQPAATVPPGGRRRAPRRRGHHDDRRPGRRASGGGTPDGPAIFLPAGWPSWASARHTTVRLRHRVPVSRAQDHSDPETRARATAVAGTIRTDGATVAAKLDAVSRERPPLSA
jgi:hypothetical protein